MTENEDKFAQFFNAGTQVAQPMSDAVLIEHIQALEEIVQEGKAHLTAAKEVQRGRSAKKKVSDPNWLTVNGPDATVTDSINKVAQRSARMSKVDKQSAKFRALGFTEKEIEGMVAGLRKVAASDSPEEKQKVMDREKLSKEAPIKSFVSPISGLFKKEDESGGETGPAIPKIKPIESATEIKPADISNLFKKKD